MSPYVRKIAAHVIHNHKLYPLDAEQKDELVSVIKKLLSDRTCLVSAVCSEKLDLINKNYRKLCSLLVDLFEVTVWTLIIASWPSETVAAKLLLQSPSFD